MATSQPHAQPTSPVPAPPAERPVVTKSFELYVDGARWLLAIVAALLAFAFAAVKESPGHWPSLLLFLALGAVLCVSAGASLLYLVYSYTYLTRREAGKPNSDKAVSGPYGRSVRAFWWMITSFAAGLVLFVIFGGAQILALRDAKPGISIHQGGSGTTIVRRGERLWVLSRGPDGEARWEALPPPPD